jgi:hypothetical protein
MKPKTKLQKKVVELSEQIIPASEKQKRWADDKLFDGHYVRSRNRNYCLECGHKWKPEDSKLGNTILKPVCPQCRAQKLNHIDNWQADEYIYQYWAIIDVVESFQLVRMIRAKKYIKKKQPAEYSHQEVMQHWIRQDGKITSLTMKAQGMGSYYYDSWIPGSDLEPRTPSHNHKMRCNLSPCKICPGRKTLPIIRRNGYRGYFYGTAPHQFFSAILRHQKAETLLKAKQIDLFRLYPGLETDTYEHIEKHWGSICIAMRNGYTVEDATLYLDYLDMLDRFDKDLNNPHYVCPDDLAKEHDRYNEKIREINRRQELKERKKEVKEANRQYMKEKAMFFGLHFSAGGIEIVPLQSVKEFLIEGDTLHHCLFSNNYYEREDSLILSARVDGKRMETIEVDLGKLKINQARGMRNRATEHHEEIVDIVQRNMSKIASIVSKHNIADFESAIKRTEAA